MPVILSLAAGANGAVWVGTPDGLNRVAPEGGVQRITSADGLPDDYIQALVGSPDGSVWVGTRHGLVHLQGSRIEVLTRANGLAGDLVGTLLLTRSGELWMGTSGGLSRRFLDGKIVNYGTHQGLGEGVVSALAEDTAGSIWVVTKDGKLSRFASGHFQQFPGRIFEGQLQGLVDDGKGSLWSRTFQGVERVSIAELNACASSHQLCPRLWASGRNTKRRVSHGRLAGHLALA